MAFRHMTEDRKKRIIRKYVIITSVTVFCIFVATVIYLYNTSGYVKRRRALDEVIAKIQAEIDTGFSEENRVVLDRPPSPFINEVHYYLNNIEDRRLFLDIIKNGEYILETVSYETSPYSEVMFIGDYEINVTLFPHLPMSGYSYDVSKFGGYMEYVFPMIGCNYTYLEEYLESGLEFSEWHTRDYLYTSP